MKGASHQTFGDRTARRSPVAIACVGTTIRLAAAAALSFTALLSLFVSLPLLLIDSLPAASLSASVLLLATSLVSASRVRPVLPSLLVASTHLRVALMLAAVRAMFAAATTC